MAEQPFRFGVVAAQAASGEEWIAKARRVEALGYATLVVPDGLRYTLAPLPALAVAAAATICGIRSCSPRTWRRWTRCVEGGSS
jgi:hypothetical protein